jgi:hypothetical protein
LPIGVISASKISERAAPYAALDGVFVYVIR